MVFREEMQKFILTALALKGCLNRIVFRGYTKEGTVLVAEPEKAPLDLIYIRYVRGKYLERRSPDSLIDDMYLEELNSEKLLRYAGGFDGTTRKILSEFLS